MTKLSEMNARPVEIFIKTMLDYSRNVTTQYNIDVISKSQSLNELRTITANGPRANGATTACARLFDPNKDIYIAWSYAAVCMFNNLLLDNNITNTKKISFLYSVIGTKDSDVIECQLIDKIINTLIHYKIENGYKPFMPFDSVIRDLLTFNYSYSYPNALRGITPKKDAIVWFDLGSGGQYIKYMEPIKKFIETFDAVAGDGTQRYVIL